MFWNSLLVIADEGFVVRYKNDDRGFMAVLAMLTLGMIVSILTSTYLGYFQRQYRVRAVAYQYEELKSLATSIQMILSMPDACTQNLSSNGFGRTLAELRTKSDSGAVRVFYPTSSGTVLGPIVSRSGNFRHIFISSMKFTSIVPQIGDPGSYSMDLEISVRDISKSIKIPFVVVTDSADQLTSCYVTMNSPQDPSSPSSTSIMTFENVLCSSAESNTFYSPSARACIPTPSTTGGL